MDRERLREELETAFGGTPGQRRAVARAAGDLADSGVYRADVGTALSPSSVVAELRDAPDECDLVERWNWWIGALDLAYEGYERFRVVDWDE